LDGRPLWRILDVRLAAEEGLVMADFDPAAYLGRIAEVLAVNPSSLGPLETAADALVAAGVLSAVAARAAVEAAQQEGGGVRLHFSESTTMRIVGEPGPDAGPTRSVSITP
jgi:hypothetical protein